MDKIPFCFPVFYHGLIARRTVYSQPEVVNLLLSGNMRAEPVKWLDVDRMTANKYINGLECFSSYRRKEIFELPDKDLLARIQKILARTYEVQANTMLVHKGLTLNLLNVYF